MSSIRVSLAQLNMTVGDITGNKQKILQAIWRAKAWCSDIVVVPELAVTGYPPEDLLLKPQFVDDNLRAIRSLARACKRIVGIVGFVDRDTSGRLYNAAAVMANGRIRCIYHKQCLPNYGVFDEKRYFSPADQSAVISIGGISIGVMICEDLWHPQPIRDLAEAGAQMALNLSASPYHAGKLHDRDQLFKERACKNEIAIAFCNLIGGQDELVFDGASLILDADGKRIANGAQFREDHLVVDIGPEHLGRVPSRQARKTIKISHRLYNKPELPQRLNRICSELEEIYEALCLGVRDYMLKNKFSKVVLGLSGGIDSALTAAIAADAVGSDNVIGIIMPSQFSSEATRRDAKRVARSLKIRNEQIPIDDLVRVYKKALSSFVDVRGRKESVSLMEQNIQARIRGNLLMALSNQFGWLVLTTGNKSEMATGYCTLYGDMAGGFAVIKDVPKTLVYRLSYYRNQSGTDEPIPSSILDRAPTAELAPNQKDQDTLPAYDVLDRILKAYVEEDQSLRDMLKVSTMNSKRIKQVIRMVDRSEYKRRQGPPGIKITPKAFGKDRRMPITNQYQQC